MSKVKAISIGIGILFVFSLMTSVYLLNESNKKKDTEIARLDFNNFQLLQDNQTQTILYLKQKEVTGRLKIERDSIAVALKIKPKTIERIIYRTITDIDTVEKRVFVEKNGLNWTIQDTGACFIWKAEASLINTALTVKRTNFSYQNKVTEVFYRHRSKKFLFIKYGKWVYYTQITPECGTQTTKTFEFEQ